MTQRPHIEQAAEILRDAERAKALIDEAAAARIAALHRPLGIDAQSDSKGDWGALKAGQRILNCSRPTALQLIVRHGLGHKLDGRWVVDLARCRAYMAGELSTAPAPL
jgi:hypothetical protein